MSEHLSRAKISSATSEMREWKSGLRFNDESFAGGRRNI